MLLHARMRSLLAASLLAAATTTASAGGFIGLGVGTAPSVSDSNDSPYFSDGRSLRLQAGYGLELKTGRLSFEGAYSGFGYIMGNSIGDGKYDSRTLQADLKYNFPLGQGFEVFGRLGLLRTSVSAHTEGVQMFSGDGNGYLLGLGAEYRLPAFGSVFIDYTRDSATFDASFDAGYQNTPETSQSSSMWMAGLNFYL